MAHGVEETLKVKVDYILVAFADYLLRSSQSIVTPSLRTEAVACLGELALIDWGQCLVDGLLHEPVYHGRYAEQALLAVVLGYLYPADGLWLVVQLYPRSYALYEVSVR